MNILRVAGTMEGGVRTDLDTLDKILKTFPEINEIHSVFYPLSGEKNREQIAHTIPLEITENNFKRYLFPKSIIGAVNTISKVVNEQSIDIVHIHSPHLPIGTISAFIAEKYNIPIVTTYHGGLRTKAVDNLAMKIFSKYPLQKASKKLAITKEAQKLSGGDSEIIGVPIDKIFKKQNQTNYFSTKNRIQNQNQNQNQNQKIIFYPARITYHKGQFDLVKAVSGVSKKFKLIIAGQVEDKEYYNSIKSYIKKKELEDYIKIIEEIPFSEMPSAYSSANFQVFPTYEEGLGKIILEAGLCEIPTIAYATGGVPEIINEETGVLTKTGDIRVLREGIQYLLSNNNKCLTLGKNAKTQYGKKFNSYDIAKRHLEIYMEENKLASNKLNKIKT